MQFAPYRPTCQPETSCFETAIMTGSRWRTEKGLRIGNPRQRLYALYPRVSGSGAWRELYAAPSIEPGLTFPGLEAKLVNRRVAAFRVNANSCEGFNPRG